MTLPVVQRCREELLALDREGREPALHAQLSQLVSLLDFATRLVWTSRGDDVPDAVLGFVMGELQASAGVVYVASEKRGFERRVARGLVGEAPATVIAVTSTRLLPASSTARDSGRRRWPLQARQPCSRK